MEGLLKNKTDMLCGTAQVDTIPTCDPRDVGGISPREPVWRDKVVQSQCIESNFKGAEVKVTMRPLVAAARRRVGENGGAAVSPSLNENCLGQLKIKVSSCLRGLIWDVGSMALRSPALVSAERKITQPLDKFK